MGAPGSTDQLCFSFDSVISPLPDGSWRVKAARPRPVQDRVTVKQVARELHYSEDQARRIVKEHVLPYQRRKGCKLFITREELERIKSQRMGLS